MPSVVVMVVTAVMIMIMVGAVSVVPVIVIVMPLPRNVFVVVPIIPHKVDRSTACVVLRAMPVPMLLVSWRDVQVDRLHCNILGRPRNHDRLRIDHGWPRDIADIDLPIEPRLADADGYTYITGKRRDSAYTQQRGKCSFLHSDVSP
jgi:hypothetical protein